MPGDSASNGRNSLSRHHNSTLRLRGFDYSTPGAYFITICTAHKVCNLGHVTDEHVVLTDIGRMVESTWAQLPVRYATAQIDAFVIMPNHLHGIVVLAGAGQDNPHHPAGQAWEPAATLQLSSLIHWFKSLTTHLLSETQPPRDVRPIYRRLWQPNYYEHVVRDDGSLDRIREYIFNNPAGWSQDRENPSAVLSPARASPTDSWQV